MRVYGGGRPKGDVEYWFSEEECNHPQRKYRLQCNAYNRAYQMALRNGKSRELARRFGRVAYTWWGKDTIL